MQTQKWVKKKKKKAKKKQKKKQNLGFMILVRLKQGDLTENTTRD